MAVKAKAGQAGTLQHAGKPKHSRQGNGKRSLAFSGKQRRKLLRGQGRG